MWKRCVPPAEPAKGRRLSEWRRNLPWSIPLCCLLITLAGLCGLLRADQLYGESRLFERQLIWLILGWIVAGLAVVVPYRSFRQYSPWIYIVAVVLLAVTLFMPPINGSRRWIPLGLMDFQASEPARLAFIMALAHYLMYRENQKTLLGLVPPFALTLVPLLLILREPDLGTAMLFLPILFAMLFAAGSRPRHLIIAVFCGVLLLPLLWQQMSAEQKSRITTVFQQRDGGVAPTGDGYHLHQSKQVLALGGVWGSVVRDAPPIEDAAAYRLPAARTDFILCMIGERYGIPGCAALLLLYLIVICRGISVAHRTQEPFGRLVVVGIVTMIGTQTLINSSMVVGLMPITGITLPLCSYGGSSLVSTCLAIGVLMNIAARPGYEVASRPFE